MLSRILFLTILLTTSVLSYGQIKKDKYPFHKYGKNKVVLLRKNKKVWVTLIEKFDSVKLEKSEQLLIGRFVSLTDSFLTIMCSREAKKYIYTNSTKRTAINIDTKYLQDTVISINTWSIAYLDYTPAYIRISEFGSILWPLTLLFVGTTNPLIATIWVFVPPTLALSLTPRTFQRLTIIR